MSNYYVKSDAWVVCEICEEGSPVFRSVPLSCPLCGADWTADFDNPYLNAIRAIFDPFEDHDPDERPWNTGPYRAIWNNYVHAFSFAIPTAEVVDYIVTWHDPLMDFACGTGYWSWMMEQKGADVKSIDAYPPNANQRFVSKIIEADQRIVGEHPDRTLFFSWPPLGASWALEAVERYDGDTVVTIQDDPEKYNGPSEGSYMEYLESNFDLIEKMDLPRWPAQDDYVYVFQR